MARNLQPRSLQPRTLRWRLTLLTAGVLALALTAGAFLLVRLLESGRVEALDAAATSRVLTVADLVRTDRLPDALGVAQPGEVVQILALDGSVLATSSNASLTLPVVTPSVVAELLAAAGEHSDGATSAPALVTAASAYSGQARVAGVLTNGWATDPATGADGSRVLVVAAVPLGDVTETVHALSLALLVAVPVLVLGLGALVWLVLGRALRPVEELRLAADAVAESGGPGSLPVPTSGELGALARTLNTMLDRLDVSAKRQSAFVADAAHELRSPIASLTTAIEVAATHPSAYPREELLSDLSADVARMGALVEDLLVLARVGSRRISPREIDLAAVVTLAREESAAQEASSGVGLEMVGAGRARGDAAATQRVVRNLVANALRHASAQVRIEVSDGEVIVSDDGSGIAATDRERVFERFVRLDAARQREAVAERDGERRGGGSGLGLAIARELAREQGGDVVLGESDLGGLRARLSLPQSEERA